MDGYAVASTWVSTIHVLEALLKAKVVVVFATKAYSERRLCRLETRLALADALQRLVCLTSLVGGVTV